MSKTFSLLLAGCLIGAGACALLYNTLWQDYKQLTEFADGAQYRGELRNDLPDGEGVLEWPNGTRYAGEFRAGQIEGEGTLSYPDGSVYEGQFSAGLAQGRGRLTNTDFTYEGEFLRDQMQGHGVQTFSSGERYTGSFEQGRFHGQGIFITADDDRYEGHFVAGVFSGTGIHQAQDGSVYEGVFEDWRFDGAGTLKDAEGRTWTGLFEDGYLDGYVSYVGTHGERYEGHYQDNLYHGYGKLVNTDGSRYEGEFEEGAYHGVGVLTHDNGDIFEGNFEYGHYHGEGVIRYSEALDGIAELAGTWSYGELVACTGDCPIQPATALAETALYNQNALLQDQLGGLKPHTQDQIDLYFLGIAGDGYEAVFRREILYARQYFEQTFQTQDRSIVLVNDRLTIDQYPLATQTSLDRSLAALSKHMGEEDILFVFLSSHGSREHALSLQLPGVRLEDLSAESLAKALKKVPIKWKVLVVSACFSGGFIPHLKDEHTLIMTAAAHDKTSFGCDDRNVFTYFGEAFFKEALPKSRSFEQAFGYAVDWVNTKEDEAELTQSEPQISTSPKIQAHLDKWRTQNSHRH